MGPRSGDLIAFLGDSVTEHLVAVSDAMEILIEDLPPVGSLVGVDRHEKRGWVALLISRITIQYPDGELRFLNAGRGAKRLDYSASASQMTFSPTGQTGASSAPGL